MQICESYRESVQLPMSDFSEHSSKPPIRAQPEAPRLWLRLTQFPCKYEYR